MSVSVFVLDRKHRPLMPCRPARARRLLKSGRARVVRLFPFTIRLTDRLIEDSKLQPVLVKIDPGSRRSGFAVVRVDEKGHHHALFFIELVHRGEYIRDALTGRSAHRRWRRGNLRHRARGFSKRLLRHSDARRRHSRYRLASLPTAFFQRRIRVCVALPRASFLPRLKTGVPEVSL